MSEPSSPGQGANSVHLRQFNERVLLAALRRRGPLSKAELARLAGLTQNATGMIVRQLEAAGLVRPVGKRYGGRGQPATLLELDPEGAYAMGVRVDRDLTETVLVDLSGQIRDRSVHDGWLDPVAAVDHIAQRYGAILALLGPAAGRLAGIGVAMPYDLGSWLADLSLPSERFQPWAGFDLDTALTRATGARVMVENDGSAAAVGELLQGRGLDDCLYLFIGPALGGGVVLGGEYRRGATGNAGDFGVVPTGPSSLDSAPATARPYRPLMARASLIALIRHLRHHGHAVDDRAGLDRALEAAPERFDEWCADAVAALAPAILTAVHVLDIPAVVIDGDLGGPWLDRLIERLAAAARAIISESRRPPVLLRGSLGPDAGALGAASLSLYQAFNPMRRALPPAPDPSELATEAGP